MTSNDTNPPPDASLPAEDTEGDFDERGEGPSFPIVGVGASAGGLEAFTQLLKALPADTGMAFVLVQHLAPTHPSALAEILSRATRMPVTEVHDEPTVEPNHVYVIPPGRSMIIAGDALQLLPREGGALHRPVDQFFRALAQEQGHQAIGVVLSGTASDGTQGLEAIKAEGGITFAQDASALHDGMPHSAIASGCVDFVLPPAEIAREIVRIGQHPYATPPPGSREQDREPSFSQVVQILHHATGVDFSHYKFNTLYRRITRRMVLHKMDGQPEYVEFLRRTPAEVEALYQDILISVTSFFRDPASFEALKKEVFPRLLKDRSPHDPVRVWTLGCSTGQEAYSLAMAFTECADVTGAQIPLQLFATDLNPAGIEKARAGLYSKDIGQDVSPERLRHFFTEVNGSYRISKSIRDACVFSRHNVLADPPFSRIDLISCRNLLIYLEPVLQQKIVPTLHYALKPAGCLWLGSSESIGGYRSLFDARDTKHKIYVKKPGSSPGHDHFPAQSGGAQRAPFVPIAARPSDAADLPREADRILLTKFAPPGVLVSADLDILQYRGDTGPYLAPAPGKATLNLLKMLREGLLVAVRAAILRAGTEQTSIREEGLRVKSNGGYHEVAIEVIPIGRGARGEGREASNEKDKPSVSSSSLAPRPSPLTPHSGGYLILFEDSSEASRERQRPVLADQTPVADAPGSPDAPRSPDPDRERLAQELAATREYLQSVIEQQESANEELQSANEEVQSANEELQSTNEELETSKEEIQSSNEEVATVNDELNNRNAELSRVNNDLVNLIASVQMPIVMLGPDLCIRRFTPAAEKLLNLIASDVGRPLADIKLNLDNLPDLEPLLMQVLDTVATEEREVRDKAGRWYLLRLRPYRTLENKIDGVIVMLVDVDAIKRAAEYAESIVTTTREPLVVLDADLRVRTASRSFYETYLVTPEETINRRLYDLGKGQWNVPELRRLLEEILPRNNRINDFEVEADFEHIGKRTMRLNGRRLVQPSEEDPLVLLAIEDITEQKRTAERLRESDERFRNLADNMSQLAWICDKLGNVTWYNRRWLDYTGLTFEDMKGWGWKHCHHPDHVDRVVAGVQRSAETGEPWDDTFPLRGKDGNYRWFLSRAVPIRDDMGNIVQWFGTNTDITEQRHMADELRQNAADMSEADHRKNEFLAMLAHELRNPLAPIRNAVQILLRAGGHGADVASASGMMERQVGQMVRLVDDLLDVSRISRGKIELRRGRTELASAVNHAVEAARPQCKTMDQELTVTLPPEPIYLYADPARLAQVVGNLLNNACKFTDKGGHIELAVALSDEGQARGEGRGARGEEDMRDEGRGARTKRRTAIHSPLAPHPTPLAPHFATIRVRDNGVGIAADQLPRIFDMFMQVDTTLERSINGLGIGLTLVKNLVEMHDGTVEVHSAGLGKGSEFVVRLPVMRDEGQARDEGRGARGEEEKSGEGRGARGEEEKADGDSLAPRPSPLPTRILVVDDNHDSAESLAMLLKLSGNDTRVANDGLEAVAAAATFRPEVILMDIGLPKLNGYEACRKIREQPWGKSIVMVALTGWGQEEDRQKSKEAGFNGHLVKPVELATVLRLLGELLPAPR